MNASTMTDSTRAVINCLPNRSNHFRIAFRSWKKLTILVSDFDGGYAFSVPGSFYPVLCAAGTEDDGEDHNQEDMAAQFIASYAVLIWLSLKLTLTC